MSLQNSLKHVWASGHVQTTGGMVGATAIPFNPSMSFYSQPQTAVENPLGDPDPLAGEIVGFRTWTLTDWGLGSLGVQGQPWVPGINVARCRNGTYHHSPEPHCGCGLYGMLRPYAYGSDDQGYMRLAGAILAWGEVMLHQTGFRAEFAKPILLIDSPHWSARQRALTKAVASYYDCDLVEEHNLLLMASEHGQLVPDAMLPKGEGGPT